MGLADFQPATKTINFKSGEKDYSFAVRGLCLEDLTYLVTEHLNDLRAAVLLYEDVKATVVSTGRLDEMVLHICRNAPVLAAEVISLAAEERELVDVYRKLPFGVMAFALNETLRLTLEDGGGLKNLFAALTKILQESLPADVRQTLESRIKKTLSSVASTGEPVKT